MTTNRNYPLAFDIAMDDSMRDAFMDNCIIPNECDFDKSTGLYSYQGWDWYDESGTSYFNGSTLNTNDISPELLGKSFGRFSVRMIPLLINLFNKINLKYDWNPICTKYGFKIEIDTSNDIISNIQGDNRKLRPEQYRFMKSICSKSGGLIQLHTSYGKNTMITYMITHYTGSGNILILAPTLSVSSEIADRACKYEYTDISAISEYRNTKVRYTTPAGFMNSNYKDDSSIKEFLSNVDMIIVDEIENVTDSMVSIFEDYCTNYKYIYGFSATANKYVNMELMWNKINYSTLSPETKSIMYYFGQCLAYKKSTKMLLINKAYGLIPPERTNPYKSDYTNYNEAVNNAIMNKQVPKYIQYIKSQYYNSVLMVPVKTNEQGEWVFSSILNTSMYDGETYRTPRVVFWSGSQIMCSNNITEPASNYDELKVLVDNLGIDVLICTSVGYRGVDFQTISDILLLIGTGNNIVNQIVGRAERYDGEIRAWILENKADRNIDWRNGEEGSTPIFNGSNGARIKQLKSAHIYIINELGDLGDLVNN